MPLVSVIMPVYNGEKYLAETIESILAQTFADFEYIIVDDGSRDRSAQIIRVYQNNDNRIRSLCLDENRGISCATNYGFEKSRGQYIALTDHDDVSLPDRLQKQVDLLNANPGISVLGTCAYIVDQDLNKPAFYDVAGNHATIALAFFVGRPFAGNTVMLRRAVFEAAGLMDSKMDSVQDKELLWRAFKLATCANRSERLLPLAASSFAAKALSQATATPTARGMGRSAQFTTGPFATYNPALKPPRPRTERDDRRPLVKMARRVSHFKPLQLFDQQLPGRDATRSVHQPAGLCRYLGGAGCFRLGQRLV